MTTLMDHLDELEKNHNEEEPKEIGMVISRKEPTHLAFNFRVDDDVDVEVGELVEVPSEKGAIVGKVSEIKIHNEYLSNPKFLDNELLSEIPVHYRFNIKRGRLRLAKVKILGIVTGGNNFIPPCLPPEPGAQVYKATEEVLSASLGIVPNGLYLGNMWVNNMKITLDAMTLLMHHIIVLGATGTGKSHFCQVLTEEFLDRHIPVLIIDPHGEYSSLAKPNTKMMKELSKIGLRPEGYKVMEYAPPKLIRENEKKIPLTIKLTDLDPEALAEICNMTDVQTDLLYLAFKRMLKERGEEATLDDLHLAVDKIAHEYKFLPATTLAIMRRLAVLEELGILGEGFSPQDMIKPATATIINLSGDMEERARRVLVATVLKKIFEARKREEIPPLLVIVDEGHRFAPQDEETYSKKILRLIAREGRKFKIGLCIASQRVVGLDKDIFSQCGTKVIFKLDCTTDLNFIQPLLESTSKEELQRLPLLPRGVAVISSICLRFPVLMKVRVRKSGG